MSERLTYREKLTDPRWQKKRLEVMERAGWCCEACGNGSRTLNVHHVYYIGKREPWEYPDSAYQCLCDSCHETAHDNAALLRDFERAMGFFGCLLHPIIQAAARAQERADLCVGDIFLLIEKTLDDAQPK